MEVEVAGEPQVLEPTQGSWNIAGEAEADSGPEGAPPSAEQDRQTAVVNDRSSAEVDHQLLRLVRERAVNGYTEVRRVPMMKLAADHENDVPPDGPARDREPTIRARRPAP